jgi:lipopolysaccharide/colanic/teichoic acid biosynthesis glycosyltransferase
MPDTEILKLTRYVNTTAGLTATPVILFADALSPAVRNRALRLNADDVYANNFDPNNVMFRIDSLRRFKAVIQNAKEPIQPQKNEEESLKHKMSAVILMLLNMAGALVAIVLAAPVIFIAAILIKLESRGPVFYVSKRVGRNYKIFNFYKLRTMRVGADAELATIKHLNQYAKSGDGTENMFIKIENDPRVTAVGRFLRKTSIDELPQIFHVLKGEMAFVGNRPLPLYEAETLTRDYCAYRFIAPAGITGKWQIMQRGKKEVTAEGRIQLDVEQAKEAHNILMVIKTMFLTIPALFQKADV